MTQGPSETSTPRLPVPFFTVPPTVPLSPLPFPDYLHEPPPLSGQDAFLETFDRLVHAGIGRATHSISPMALSLATFNWLCHLAVSPGKQHALAESAASTALRFLQYAGLAVANPDTPDCITPLSNDKRFADPEWRHPPFNLLSQAHLLTQAWWEQATTGVHGVYRHHQQLLTFLSRQVIDIFSPSNFLTTNPVILKATLQQGGANLMRGYGNWVEDTLRSINHQPPKGCEAYQPGVTVAVTPGQVIMRNRLVELIQYSPTTPDVHADPVLIVPAWIMKYYILDLSPHNSLVKYLVGRGHTVFMVSWRNPDSQDQDLGMDDYALMGVLDSIKAVQAIVPKRKIHAVGYCLGGTLLSMVTAHLARQGDTSLQSLSLFATQTDFTEAGELSLFIDEAQVALLEDVMWSQGYLDTSQMAGAFQLLRSNDLIWSRLVHDYLMGEQPAINDMMAWNADTTRMPYRMHSEYLRRLFMENDLFEGRYQMLGHTITLSDIHTPIFAVATETDHVAPWRSVYKIHLLSNTEVTFVLTNGGHNAGIISEPGHPKRQYRMATRPVKAPYEDSHNWADRHAPIAGSWWPAWVDWLERQSSGRGKPPPMGAEDLGYPPLCPAPGSYVLQK